MLNWTGKAGAAVVMAASVLGSMEAGTNPALADSAGDQLLQQGSYWRARNRPDLAIDALSRLLRAEPNRTDALYQITVAEAQSGNAAEAQKYFARFRAVAPNDPRIAEMELAIKAGKGTPPEIAAARQQARQNPGQAVQAYRNAFNGGPPPDQYALEYYSTLAGTTGPGGEEARKGLEGLVQRTGGDVRARLALARTLIYREETRRQGIQQLAQLADDPTVGKEAVENWQQGIVWLGPNPRDRGLMQAFLNRFPDNTAIRSQLAQAERPAVVGPGADPGALQRAAAFGALNRGNVDVAAQEFERTLRTRPSDPDALGGLGIVRLRQQRFAEARDLLARAVRGGGRSRYEQAYASAAFFADLAEARQAIASGNSGQGIALLRQSLSHPNPQQGLAEQLLADTLASTGDLPGAERYYRTVLGRNPDDADALVGLFGVLNRENRQAEALQLVSRLTQADRGRVPGAARVQGEVLRAQAQAFDRSGQYARAGAAYAQAFAADPNSPFLRLDYARFLARQGNVAQANSLVAGLTAPQVGSAALMGTARQADVLYAAALYYNDQHRAADAIAVLSRIPQAERTADMNGLYDRLATSQYTERAVQIARAGNIAEAEQLLAQLRAQGPGSIDRSVVIAQAYIDIGDHANALQVAQEGLARAPQAPPGALLQYVGILLATDQPALAASLISQLDGNAGLTGPQRRDLARLHADLASDRAAQTGGFGDLIGAYTIVANELARDPSDPALTLSLARIYAAAGRPGDALNLFDRVLYVDPQNFDAIRGAVGAAIDAREISRAYGLIDRGLDYYPNSPRLYYLKGQVALAEGDRFTARHALEEAKILVATESEGLYTAPVYGAPTAQPGFALPPVPAFVPPQQQRPASTSPTTLRPAPLAPATLAPAADASSPSARHLAETDVVVVDASALTLTAARLSEGDLPSHSPSAKPHPSGRSARGSSPAKVHAAQRAGAGPQSGKPTRIIAGATAASAPAVSARADHYPADHDSRATEGDDGDDLPAPTARSAAAPAISTPDRPSQIRMTPPMPVQMAQALPVQIAQMQPAQTSYVPMQMPIQIAQAMPVQLAQMQVAPGRYVQVQLPQQMAQMPVQMMQMPQQIAQVPVQMAQGYPMMYAAPQGYAMQQPMMVQQPVMMQPMMVQQPIMVQQPMMVQQPVMMAPGYQQAPVYAAPQYAAPAYAAPAYAAPPSVGRPLFQQQAPVMAYTQYPGYAQAPGPVALPRVPEVGEAGSSLTATTTTPQTRSPVEDSSAVPSQALAPLPAAQALPGDAFLSRTQPTGLRQNTIPIQAPVPQPFQAPAYQAPAYAPPSYPSPVFPSAPAQLPTYRTPAAQLAPPTFSAPSYSPPAPPPLALRPNPSSLPFAPTPFVQQPSPSFGYGAVPPLAASNAQPGFDPLQQDIDASLAQLGSTDSPFIKGSVGGDFRDGESGLSQLFTVTAPVSFTFNPFYLGSVTLGAAPTYSSAGSLAGDSGTLRRFGTNNLVPTRNAGFGLQNPVAGSFADRSPDNFPAQRNQNDAGVGLNLAYSNGPVSADVGTTPLGFHIANIIGGVSYAPQFIDNTLTVRLEGARRPIVDSLLSYAGTKDPLSGLTWGGVVRSGGRAELDYDDGDFGAYGGGGYFSVTGADVASNDEGEGTIGGFFRPLRRANYALKAGINLSYVSYNKNLRFFTLGQGGYFSPQSYGSVSFPVEFDGRYRKFTYLGGIALGVQSFSENSSKYFPNRSDLQSLLSQEAAIDPAIQTRYPSRSTTSALINLRAQAEYEIRPSLVVGGSATFSNARDYNEGSVLVYFKQLLGSGTSNSTASLLGSNDGVFSMVRRSID